MTGGVETIRALIENAGSDPRRSVQAALATAAEQGTEEEILNAINSESALGYRWLTAALVERVSGTGAAKTFWERVVAPNGCEIPEILVHRARVLIREGEVESAAPLIRLALQNSRSYDLYLRAESVARKCKAGFGAKHRLKVALLSSSTTTLLRNVLELLFMRDGFDVEWYEPLFGTYAQELLADRSGLKSFSPDFVVLILNWRDLGLTNTSESKSEVNAAVARIGNLWKAARRLSPRKIIHLTFSPPATDASLALSYLTDQGKTRTVRSINEGLFQFAEDSVVFVDSERIAASFAGHWEDPVMWSSAKVYPAPTALPTLGEHIVSIVRSELGLSRKLLVLDLDNTLWGGVIGEDGIDGIRLGPPSAIGERYVMFQDYLKDLKERGVLLAVASKNNPEDAKEALLRHPNSKLNPDDFVSLKVNWKKKADNIREIAEELNLGLDSFVFLDDSPAERSSVRRDLPNVIVPEISGEPVEAITALESGLYFQAMRLTDEDKNRVASYTARARQIELSNSTASLDDYLSGLGMEIESGPIDGDTCIRVTQLINKTNQFNLTTPRYSLEEVQLRMASPDYWCRWYRLKDRFADHGIIGVLIVKLGSERWSVDTWLMSCRVIGREVESFMFRSLVHCAQQSGAKGIVAEYYPTTKNGLVAQLLPRFGFKEHKEQRGLLLDLPTASLPECRFMREVQICRNKN